MDATRLKVIPRGASVTHLKEYATQTEDLEYPEYCFKVQASESGEDKTLLENLHIVLAALLNTSGGLVNVEFQDRNVQGIVPRWKKSFLNGIRAFVPEHVIDGCIHIQESSTPVDVIIKKSPTLITVRSHLYVRDQAGDQKHVTNTDQLFQIVSRHHESGPCAKLPPTPFSNTTEIQYGSRPEAQEGRNLQFKNWGQVSSSDGGDTKATYKTALQEMETATCMFSFPNTTEGGSLVIGIEENVVVGQMISQEDETSITHFLEEFLSRHEEAVRIWGDRSGTPVRHRDWDVQFIPVVNGPEEGRRRLIVIRFSRSSAGVFMECPESYIVSEKGHIQKMTFDDWRNTLLDEHRIPTISMIEYIIPRLQTSPELVFALEQMQPFMKLINEITAAHSMRHFPIINSEEDLNEEDGIGINMAMEYIQQKYQQRVFGVAASHWPACLRSEVTCDRPAHHMLDVFIIDSSGHTELWGVIRRQATAYSPVWQYLFVAGRLTKRKLLFEEPAWRFESAHNMFVKCRLYQIQAGEKVFHQNLDLQKISAISENDEIQFYVQQMIRGKDLQPTPLRTNPFMPVHGDIGKIGGSERKILEGGMSQGVPSSTRGGVLPQPKRTKTREELSRKIAITDRYMKFAFLEVGADGGWFKIPDMGVEIMIPSGALEEPVTLKFSIVDSTDSFPKTARGWSKLSASVRIEPENVEYKKPVYLFIRHNLQTILSEAPGRQYPVLLHRHKADAPWSVIPCSEKQSAENPPEIHGFKLCTEKQAVLTSTAVVVAMRTNCEHCLCFPNNDQLKQVMRMSVRLYAEFQQGGGLLNIRAYAIHDTPDRITEIDRNEREQLGGHLLGETIAFVDRNQQDLIIRLGVSADGQQIGEQTGNVNYHLLCVELDRRYGSAPIHEFTAVNVNAGAAAAPPSSIQIEANISQCQVGGQHTIRIARDLQQLAQSPPQVSSQLLLQEIGKTSHPSSQGYLYGAAPIQVSRPRQQSDRIVDILKNFLTKEEMEKVRRYVDIQDHEKDERLNIRDMILNIFVGDKTVDVVIGTLQALGIMRDEIEQLLRAP